MKVGVVVFPASNCEQDCQDAIANFLGANHPEVKVKPLWHQSGNLEDVECIILPGGFSYGDYLRGGAIAKFSPIMQSVIDFAKQGRPILGICNGFQILTEAHLLPGTLARNEQLQFVCDRTPAMTAENNQTRFTKHYKVGETVHIPVAHGEGNYYASGDDLKRLEDNNQVVFRYVENINGASNNIAGICNETGSILGMMPHPERNLWAKPQLGWTGDGAKLFDSLLESFLAEIV